MRCSHGLAERALGQAFQTHLQGLEVDDVEQRDIGDDGRQEGVLDDLQIADAGVFGHQEGRRPHHRRGQLAVDRGRHLDGARLFGRKAGALHERDGEDAGRDHIGDGGAGIDAGKARRHHRSLGRAAAQVAQQRKRQLDEIVAGTGLFQHGAEQHEQKDHRGRDAQRHAEHAFELHPEMPQRLAQGSPLPLDGVRQDRGMAEEHVEQEHHRHAQQRQAQRAVYADAENDHADGGNDQIGRGRQPGTLGDGVLEDDQIKAGDDAGEGEQPVVPGYAVARRPAAQRKGEGGEAEGKGQMHHAGFGRIEDEADMDAHGGQRAADGILENERQAGGDIELIERPDNGDARDDAALPAARMAPAGIGFDQIVLGPSFGRCRRIMLRHHFIPPRQS